MRKTLLITAVVISILGVAYSQGLTNGWLGLGPVGSASGCPTATATNPFYLCPASDGKLYMSNVNVAGGLPQAVGGSSTSPVTSVFGRTGVITAQSGDYTWGMITAQPTTFSCAAATIGPTGISGTSCTFK